MNDYKAELQEELSRETIEEGKQEPFLGYKENGEPITFEDPKNLFDPFFHPIEEVSDKEFVRIEAEAHLHNV